MGELSLKNEWARLTELSGVSLCEAEFSNIVRAYSEPHRCYHTLRHLEHMLAILNEVNFDSVAGLWAVWYHDYVYKPGASDNEIKSAEFAVEIMRRLGIDQSIIDKTTEIILATKDHNVKSTSVEMLTVLDADMAILGVNADKYEEYRMQVREEFKTTPDFLFKRGRFKFLEAVLAQDRIYKTDWFFRGYEQKARQNMSSEITLM